MFHQTYRDDIGARMDLRELRRGTLLEEFKDGVTADALDALVTDYVAQLEVIDQAYSGSPDRQAREYFAVKCVTLTESVARIKAAQAAVHAGRKVDTRALVHDLTEVFIELYSAGGSAELNGLIR